MTVSISSLIIYGPVTRFRFLIMLIRFETNPLQRRLVSKINATFSIFDPSCKIRGGVGEISE